jgi:hypothetical protein
MSMLIRVVSIGSLVGTLASTCPARPASAGPACEWPFHGLTPMPVGAKVSPSRL